MTACRFLCRLLQAQAECKRASSLEFAAAAAAEAPAGEQTPSIFPQGLALHAGSTGGPVAAAPTHIMQDI